MAKTKFFIVLIFLSIAIISCKERFDPKLSVVSTGYLVVEGFINAAGPTQIKLSRTTRTDEEHSLKAEHDAIVNIEGDDGSSYTLSGLPDGIYSSAALSLSQSPKYRLRIRTKDAREYLSEFGEVKITPAIDSVSWVQDNNGVWVNVNTHDPQNKTIYYRWEYIETWEIQSAFVAAFKLDSIERVTGFRIIREINAGDPPIYTCWKYDSSKNILVASSAKLEKDVISRQPILFIPRKDERLGIRYSIQMTQQALDKQGYQFYEQLKKNTESLGSVFDPLPSDVRGNIHCVSHPEEIVIGYINTTTLAQDRIFISPGQLSGSGFNIHSICETKVVANNQDSLKMYIPSGWPYEAIYGSSGGGIIAYNTSSEKCVDCTLRGGKNIKPSFW